ncbi:ABC transporter ATP-binding protein OS=Streptomyces alboniger OX=132473 GN=CP975_12415 PE=4 SV=1 [Streptomyces alboniger]
MAEERGGSGQQAAGWAKRLTGYAWRYPKDVVLALGSSLVGMAVMALVPLITKVIIDDVIGPDGQGGGRSMAPWAGALIGAAVLVYIATYIRRYYGGRLALDVQHDLRTEMYGTITKLDGRRQDELSTGQVVGRATSDLQLIQGLLFMLPMTIGNILLFVISLVIMAWLSLPLTLVALAVAPALWVIARRSRSRLHPATWYAQAQAAAVAGVVDGAVSGVRWTRSPRSSRPGSSPPSSPSSPSSASWWPCSSSTWSWPSSSSRRCRCSSSARTSSAGRA